MILLTLSGVLALFAALMLQSMKELMRREWERLEKDESLEYEGRQDRRGSASG
jgi:hypothetical protein